MRRLVVLVLVGVCVAQNPWVRRKKKEEEEVGKIRLEEEEEEEAATEFARLNKLVSEMGETDLSGAWDGLSEMYESLLESPEMKELLEDPAKLKAAITENPLLKSLPGMDEHLDTVLDSFQDPEKLREAMKVGMDAFKTVGKEFTKELGSQMEQLVNDPAAFQKQLSDTIANFMNDEEMLKAIPGFDQLTPEQLQAQLAQAQDLFKGMLGQDDAPDLNDEVEVLPGGRQRGTINARQ